jgi:hypothetical protein
MHFLLKNRRLCPWTMVLLLSFLSIRPTPAFTTGVPSQFSIAPATVRPKDRPTTEVTATVVLKKPAPMVFVCSLRTADRNKVSFPNIVFHKDQLEGISLGTVTWANVLKECEIRVSVFSVDDPGTKLWFTIRLKPAEETKPPDTLPHPEDP